MVPREAATFARGLRNDTTYPSHARVREADFGAAVMHFNFSAMGADFAASARAHQLEVEALRAQQGSVVPQLPRSALKLSLSLSQTQTQTQTQS